MKNLIQETMQIALPKFTLLLEMFTKPIFGLIAITPVIAATPIVDFWSAVHLLKWLFIGDLITGLGASYLEWKKGKKKDRWFFGKGEGFSSDKFKKMFVKIIVYCATPIAMFKLQTTFAIKNIKYETIMDAEMNISTALILLFCLNEGFSIFHENLPKCGFNLWERVRKMIGFYKEVKKEIE